jgi:hypothetical protein
MIRVKDAKYISHFRLQLLFEISDFKANRHEYVSKEVDLQAYVMSKKDTGIFAPLKNIDFFKHFKLNANTVEWANGADIAPEKMYEIAV